MDPYDDGSPRRKARIAGVFYLLNMGTAIFSMFGGSTMLVAGDAPATAANILAHQTLFRLCFASNLVAAACYLVVTLLLYDLLRPVDRGLSLLAAAFSLVGCAVGAFASVFRLATLFVLQGSPTLSAFTLPQSQSLARLLLKMEAFTLDVSIIFFGFYCVLLGFLIFRSTFLPRAIGALVILSGLGWLTYLSPPLATSLASYLPITGLLGEGSLALWLLIAGLNPQRWSQQASHPR